MSEINLKLKTYDQLTMEITTLQLDKYTLQQRIDKAIEYIEDTQTIKDEVFEDEYGIPISIKSKLMVGSETLLDILKGSDK